MIKFNKVEFQTQMLTHRNFENKPNAKGLATLQTFQDFINLLEVKKVLSWPFLVQNSINHF